MIVRLHARELANSTNRQGERRRRLRYCRLVILEICRRKLHRRMLLEIVVVDRFVVDIVAVEIEVVVALHREEGVRGRSGGSCRRFLR